MKEIGSTLDLSESRVEPDAQFDPGHGSRPRWPIAGKKLQQATAVLGWDYCPTASSISSVGQQAATGIPLLVQTPESFLPIFAASTDSTPLLTSTAHGRIFPPTTSPRTLPASKILPPR